MSATSRKIEISHPVSTDPSAGSARVARVLCVTALATSLWLAGCATDRLDPAAPKGINLTGEWQLNPNLSDDPQKPLPDEGSSPSELRHRSGRSRGSVGLPPFGLPAGAGGPTGGAQPDGTEDFTSIGEAHIDTPYVRTLWQTPESATGGTSGSSRGRSRGNRFGHWLDAPDHMTIEQNGDRLTIQTRSSGGETKTDEFVSGHATDVPFDQSTADRDVGWRGNVFVVDTKVKSGPTKEDDYALDDDGRLIVSTFMTGGHMPKVDIKRVYDRVTAAQGVHR